MILFKPEHVEPILAGRKTQTRRVGKKRWNVGSIHQARLNYYAKPFARIKILAVRQERLGDISEEDARREGYGSVEEYRKVFERIYGRWVPDEMVWAIDFEVVGS
ncbi:MAG: ASCH domain-containing protein [Firmicutes bacterium]|nr:ASCH domain-containing protein [Bacillota bacterium]